MKKVIVFFLTVFMFSSATWAVNYRGFAEFNGGLSLYNEYEYGGGSGGYFSFSTTHGVQLNRHLYVGAGVDVSIDTWADEYPLGVSVFGNIRYDFDIVKKWSPYISVKAGYRVKSAEAYCSYEYVDPVCYEGDYYYDSGAGYVGYAPFFINPSIGIRLKLSSKCGLNFGVGYIPLSLGKKALSHNWYGMDSEGEIKALDKAKGAFTLNFGVDF